MTKCKWSSLNHYGIVWFMRLCEHVCVCERESDSVYVCVCVRERESAREMMRAGCYLFGWKRMSLELYVLNFTIINKCICETYKVCVCVCVCVLEREHGMFGEINKCKSTNTCAVSHLSCGLSCSSFKSRCPFSSISQFKWPFTEPLSLVRVNTIPFARVKTSQSPTCRIMDEWIDGWWH